MRKPKAESPDWGNTEELESVELPGAAPTPERVPNFMPATDAGRELRPPYPQIPSTFSECLTLLRRVDCYTPPRDKAARAQFRTFYSELRKRTFELQQIAKAPTFDGNSLAATTSARLSANSVVAAAAFANTLRARIKARTAKANRK